MGGVIWIEASGERIEVVGDVVVPFEPRRDAERRLRADLRSALGALDLQRSEVLVATFGGVPPRGADVENLLLYNIDSGGRLFSRGCGVQVELSQPARDAPFAYRYARGTVDQGWAGWRDTGTLAEWDDVTIPRGSRDRLLARVWLGLRRSTTLRVSGRVDGAVGLRLAVGVPAKGLVSPGGLVKGLIDGVVSALTRDAAPSADVAARVDAQLGLPTGAALAMLTSAPAVFGERRLLVVRGGGVQWLPPDDALVAARVDWERMGGDEIRLAGTLSAVER